jgi:hypothetical protein
LVLAIVPAASKVHEEVLMSEARIGAALMFCLACGTASAQPSILEFSGAGICNASAAIAIDENRIMVGDDEKSVLPIFDLPGLRFLDTTDFGGGEADVEGGTILQGRVIWITSHGRNSSGKVRPDRQRLFASHRIGEDGKLAVLSPVVFTGLLAAVTAKAAGDPTYRRMSASIGTVATDATLAPKLNGFNIEGLTTTEGLESPPATPGLLVALRNPGTESGQAILFEVLNALALVDGSSDQAQLGRTFQVDLGGRRIRDIAFSPAAGAYLIIGGPVGDNADKPTDGGSAFAIFKWNGRADVKPARTDAFGDLDALDEFHAEAILPLLARVAGKLAPSNRVLLLSDDGKHMVGGRLCQDLPSPQQRFRGLISQVD